MALKPLAILEAEGKEIKLTNVPAKGATARIPIPPYQDPIARIEVLIAGQVVAKQFDGAPEGGFYEILVPRNHLLDHTGLKKAFEYVLYDDNDNSDNSESIEYDILHS
ncbi:hypothetical protein [Pseudomonas frederiksbergensis]|uniref:Uncharacterized protein n=1 Tax=Pseudomonas frederiksbergensis TaxID=104087 RepID=A0AB33EDJ6_9PSED|nr:hypothetical protein [Pseudomonas frederiksbergensis]ATE78473.1 hypothetical protein CNN82_19360 [Pseudomonas frederiksbergensis]